MRSNSCTWDTYHLATSVTVVIGRYHTQAACAARPHISLLHPGVPPSFFKLANASDRVMPTYFTRRLTALLSAMSRSSLDASRARHALWYDEIINVLPDGNALLTPSALPSRPSASVRARVVARRPSRWRYRRAARKAHPAHSQTRGIARQSWLVQRDDYGHGIAPEPSGTSRRTHSPEPLWFLCCVPASMLVCEIL